LCGNRRDEKAGGKTREGAEQAPIVKEGSGLGRRLRKSLWKQRFEIWRKRSSSEGKKKKFRKETHFILGKKTSGGIQGKRKEIFPGRTIVEKHFLLALIEQRTQRKRDQRGNNLSGEGKILHAKSKGRLLKRNLKGRKVRDENEWSEILRGF